MLKSFLKKIAPNFLLDWYHLFLSLSGALLYGFPSKKMIIIGVTGTNGKTTVVDLITRVLQEAGNKIASASSIKFKIGESETLNTLKMTMPGRFKLQSFLRRAVNAGCKYAVVEVTSEGILQYRHRFIDFDIAVFTNLSPEHLERHGSFEKYRQAKEKLFKNLNGSAKKRNVKKVIVANLDDKNVEYFLNIPSDEKYGYAISGHPTHYTEQSLSHKLQAINCETNNKGSVFTINGQKIEIPLLGKFNIYNAMAAICVGLSQGIDLDLCKKALKKAGSIPGRMEVVAEEPFKVIIDYAVTPNALEEVYKTIRRIFNPANLICVFGACGGGRDKWKRPVLGKIAAGHCNKIIITNEDPYDENPYQILSQIKSGINETRFKSSDLFEVLDRREAIKKALELAGSGDAVIITGKGHEPWICLADGERMPWNDSRIALEEFQKVVKLKPLAVIKRE